MELNELFREEILNNALALVNQGKVRYVNQEDEKLETVITIDHIEYPVECNINDIESGMYKNQNDGEALFYAACYIQYKKDEALTGIFYTINDLTKNQLLDLNMAIFSNHPELLSELDQYLNEIEETEEIKEINRLYDLYDQKAYGYVVATATSLMDEIIDDYDIDDDDVEKYLIRLAALLSNIYDDTDEFNEEIEEFVEKNQGRYSDFIDLSEITALFDIDDLDDDILEDLELINLDEFTDPIE